MNKTAKKILKLSGIFIAALIVLLIAVALVLPFIIDPNDYRNDIETAVTDATGRAFEIAGPMELSVFPWLGLEINDVTLGNKTQGNAPGFGSKPFAHLDSAEIQVKLLPLLSSEIEVGDIVISGLEVNLARNAQGKTNWADLVGKEKSPESAMPQNEEPTGGFTLANLKIGGITLADARITYTDAKALRQYTIAPLNLEVGAFTGSEPFELDLSTGFAMTNPELKAQLAFTTQVQLGLADKHYVLSGGDLQLSVSGSPVPIKQAELHLGWEKISADLQQQTVNLANMVLQAHGARLELSGQINAILDAPKGQFKINVPPFTPDQAVMGLIAERLPEKAAAKKLAPFAFSGTARFDLGADTARLSDASAQAGPVELTFSVQAEQITQQTPQLAGTLNVAPLSPTAIANILGVALPERADTKTLTTASLQTGFEATPNSVTLQPLLVSLDQSQLTGRVALPDIAAQKLRFDLVLDGINLDRYLPPASKQAPEATSKGKLDDIKLPVEPVRGLNIEGSLKVGQLQAAGLKVNDLVLGISASNNVVQLHPLTANLYDGSLQADIIYDVSGAVPKVSINESLQGVQIGELLTAMFDLTRFTGKTSLTLDVAAQGKTVGELRRSLDGTAAVALKDGALLGASLWDAITGAYAEIQGKDPAASSNKRTPITELSMSLQINDGIAKNDDLKARLPYLAVTGNGVVDLVENAVDYHLRTEVISTSKVDDVNNIQQLEGLVIPVRIKGSFSDFTVRPDLGSALEAKSKAAVAKAKKEARAKAQQRLEQEKQAAKEAAEEEAEEALKDKLKGLFD